MKQQPETYVPWWTEWLIISGMIMLIVKLLFLLPFLVMAWRMAAIGQ